MKILVKNLSANPYREIKKYPIDRAKIEALKISIKNTSFWDNILIRPYPKKKGEYQLAYGHHRYVALKELKIKSIDVPVRKLGNAMMVKIMAEENLGWSQSPAVIVQTIDSVRKFLNAELVKCKSIKSAEAKFNLGIFPKDSARYAQLRKEGVGKITISKFLGGNWNPSKVGGALEVLDAENLNKEAIKDIPTMYQVGKFREAVKEHDIPKAKQKDIAEKIVKEDIGGRDIPDTVMEYAKPKTETDPVEADVKKAERTIKEIGSLSIELNGKMTSLEFLMKKLNVEEMKGLNVIEAGTALKNLWFRISKMLEKTNRKQLTS